ncbi:plexin-B3-like isoform X2 [Xenopus laevis]|uniref:Plexin-B3-like isoform X2 n=1 Tax=Xenopus laevis TaxID=8355 RepID=A0A8J1LGB2_XENLA|nr:plexin-B3-like isoform X2 [Xenopus laevis]
MLGLAPFLLSFLCNCLPVSTTSFFLRPNVTFNHMARDPTSGFIYIGAVNWIFQLSPDLQLLFEDSTGPREDSPECLPFKELKDCPQATVTPNTNKLLTVNVNGSELITCGQVFQGICEKRRLSNISDIIFQTIDPGDNQFVAANDPKVTTVGIVEGSLDNHPLLFVGRGLTARLSSGIPPITIRQLGKTPVFSNEGLGKLVVGDFSDYNNTFVGIFSNKNHVYFLFFRRGKSQMDYNTYLGSVCTGDIHLYSYVEVPLVCQGGYNLAQAAYLETRNGELFVVFAASQGPTPNPSSRTALCSYKMEDIEMTIERARELCYTAEGKNKDNKEEAVIEYGVNSKCVKLSPDSPKSFQCGGEHTPSPIASRVPVEATPLLEDQPSLTAVAALAEDTYTVAFLGDAAGNIHKVFVSSNTGVVYSKVASLQGSPVNSDLILDDKAKQLYVMTESKVTKMPVAECSSYSSCDSCLAAGDPFCGWCVLQGRCTEKQQCPDYTEKNHYLWSYDKETKCLAIEDIAPANLSRTQQTEVTLTVPRLLFVKEQSSWKCLFGDIPNEAHIIDDRVTCRTPLPNELPPSEPGKDHVVMRLALIFETITVVERNFSFYDCEAVMKLAVTAPCAGCVSSQWDCHWCVNDYRCTHDVQNCSPDHAIIDNQSGGPDACPRIESVDGSTLIPVGVERELDLFGRNLQLLKEEVLGYSCVIEAHGTTTTLPAQIENVTGEKDIFQVHCQTHKFEYSLHTLEHRATVYVKTGNGHRVDDKEDIQVVLYNCSVGQSDCSRCQALHDQYNCMWCAKMEGEACLHQSQCQQSAIDVCPTPTINSFSPLTGIIEGGTTLAITGANMGQKAEDVSVKVAGHPCTLLPDLYITSNRIVCTLSASDAEKSGPVEVYVDDQQPGVSAQHFTYQDPVLQSLHPLQGPAAGGTLITITGSKLLTGDLINVTVGDIPCKIRNGGVTEEEIHCATGASPIQEDQSVSVFYGSAKRIVEDKKYSYTENPSISSANPSRCFQGGGRVIWVEGTNMDVVETPVMTVLAKLSSEELGVDDGSGRKKKRKRRRKRTLEHGSIQEFSGPCHHNSSSLLKCYSPSISETFELVDVFFVLDNVRIPFSSLRENFTYIKNPTFKPLNRESPSKPYNLKPGNVLDIEGEGLDSGISKQEVVATIGHGICNVKTLTHNHLYCEPPPESPQPLDMSTSLPEFVVHMGNLQFNLGQVKYDVDGQTAFPKEAKIGLAVGAALLVPIVLIIIYMYRRQSKMAMRDYKKVLVQLENLETRVGDQCRKEFSDLMTEMMDLSSELEGSGIPFLDSKTYVEKIFFPVNIDSPLPKSLDVPAGRRSTVEQGLTQLSNLLNNKLFLTKLIETLDAQLTLSQRDRCHAASLLTVALHGKLEYLTDVMKTLLANLIDQCVAKNPKLLFRRTETIVEKLLTNWMSICLQTDLREAAAEPLYMLYCAIKYQVDKGPVDAVTGKAKRTLNDCHLLREDIDYHLTTLTVIVKSGRETHHVPVKVLDTDTITQVKQKILNQVYKGTPFSQRPAATTLDLEWRSGNAGHLTLSDEDLTSLIQDQWKRLNTLHHYKVPDNATVALIPRLHNNQCETPSNSFIGGEKTPMLEDGEEGGIRIWHLVKPVEEPEVCKNRRSSMRERERAKAIPEIFLTRLLSMKGTLQKFVDDAFQVMLGVNRPVPIAIKYFFDFLDEMAEKHEITDAETVHIWKTNSLMLRFWVLILKNPQMVFDVEVSENVDSILAVIAQTFIDSCIISEHKVGRDSPVNKLLYAREIPRYKQLVENYYADIKNTPASSYQEMNSFLTEQSGAHSAELDSLVALQELYNYINKYYDQISSALEEDPNGQKMQLAYRLQQISALVENKVTDL